MDINKIWKSQDVPQPDLEGLRAKMNTFRSKRIRKVWFTNVALILTGSFVLAIGFSVNPKFVTTWIGIILTVLSMLIVLVVYTKILPLYKSLNSHSSNQEYMDTLLAIKQKEAFLTKKMLNLYFIFLSVGIGLYMIEYVMMMELKWGIFAYAVTTIWFGLNWFVFRPKQIKKQQEGLTSIIRDLENVSGQLK
jgi:predicted signal transduction protein with EAL and GGDEF domain